MCAIAHNQQLEKALRPCLLRPRGVASQPRRLGWLRYEHRTTKTEAALVAIPTHYRVFTRHTLVGCGRSGLIRADQHLFAHPYLDILVPSRT